MGLTVAKIKNATMGLLLIGAVVPVSVQLIMGANVTGWNATVKTIFQVVVPVVGMVGIAFYLVEG